MRIQRASHFAMIEPELIDGKRPYVLAIPQSGEKAGDVVAESLMSLYQFFALGECNQRGHVFQRNTDCFLSRTDR